MKLNRHTVTAIFILALFVQLTIITYNYFTGYIIIPTFSNFVIRLAIGTAFSFVFALLLVYLNLRLINKLDIIFPLPEKLIPRVPVELMLSVAAGSLIGSMVTVIAGLLMPYEDGLLKNIINNSLITSVLNIIIVTVIEALMWYRRNRQAEVKAEKLEKENAQIRFETLKSQLNPHFLFNSLNALSSLIRNNPVQAQEFVEEFSSVYRYTLDVIDKPVTELREELEFAKSFLFLQKIRFGNSVEISIDIDASKLNYLLPSLAVQTLIENAFKHNRASEDNPLRIKISTENNYLVITNNLQLKNNGADSKGVGQSNLNKRYKLLGEDTPMYLLSEKEYTAKIPLIDPEDK